MVAGIFHEGSGLGDQLFRYITVRTLAEQKGFEYGMVGNFKGDFFPEQPHKGVVPEPTKEKPLHMFYEKDIRDAQGNDIRSYDPEINFVEDNTIIDGSFEDDKYWRYNLENINKWLAVEPLEVSDDLCVIGFRGGEYASQPDLFLPRAYYAKTMDEMYKINPEMKFEVHTDDPGTAVVFFTPLTRKETRIRYVENPKISHSKHENMGYNWRAARYAKHAIIPNSAFFILPRILKHLEDPTAVTIAPRGWARRNLAKGENAGDYIWARPACWYPEFLYV